MLTFYGISRRDVYCFIVTEYCPYALDALLAGARVADDVLARGKSRPTPRLTVAARTTILYQVALALQSARPRPSFSRRAAASRRPAAAASRRG